MRKEKQTQPNSEYANQKEKISENAAFKKFSGGFEVYQKLLLSNKDQASREEIIKRMCDFYKHQDAPISDGQENIREEAYGIIDAALEECKQGTFSTDKFADKIATSKIYDLFLKDWTREEGYIDKELGMTYVNETVAYVQENDQVISLHIRPTAGKDVITSIIEGLKKVGSLLEGKKITADKIVMKSWLFNGVLEKKVRQILGQDISIESVSSDDNDVDVTQHLAIQFSRQMMKKYLETGKKPEVKQIYMDRDKFVTNIRKL